MKLNTDTKYISPIQSYITLNGMFKLFHRTVVQVMI